MGVTFSKVASFFISLDNCSFEVLFDAFNTAFADYDAPSINFLELKQMWERRGMNAKLSFSAFDDGKLASFTLTGIGIWNGLCTAYKYRNWNH